MNDELSKNARALLDAARPQGGPTRAQKAKLTVAVMTATASTAAAMTTGAAATGTSVLKLLGAGLIATIVGVSSTVLVKKASEPPRAPAPTVVARSVPNPVAAPPPVSPEPPSVEPQSIVVEEAPEVAAPAPTVQPAAIGPPRPPQAAPAEPTTPEVPEVPAAVPARHATPSDTTAAEVTALGAALEALEEGRPLEALQTARTARRAAPHGALRPELTVIEIEALCALQRQPEASELAASMPESDRTPLVVQRLRRTCAAR
ncbi:MAG: hypothetical protein Q8L14_21175 [Myxococcales bacterium]|nr:hypothetical protein [Myxococcales bacterium]